MNTRINPILFICWLLLPLWGIGQSPPLSGIQQQFLEAFQAGDNYLSEKKLIKAQKAFERVIRLKPDMAAAYRRLGLVHQLLENYEKAANYYDRCIEINPYLSRAVYFQSGEMYLKSGNYTTALERLKTYQDFQKLLPELFENGALELETEAHFNTFLITYLDNCQFALEKEVFKDIAIQNLGPAINSKADDCFPYLSNDESWMFYTRFGKTSGEEKLMHSTFSEKGSWAEGKPLLTKSVNADFNQGMGKATRDEQKMYFPGCNREDILGMCDIFMANMKNGVIQDIFKLSDEVNSDSWDSQPSINCEGKSLYFASDRKGGYGGTDIWVSHKAEDGSWSEAINLGPNINTEGDEESPFIADDNVTLYFASNGHPGFGDQDIFFTRKSSTGAWSQPLNLGRPINSKSREISFFMNARGNKGYMASNREGGEGGLDIYQFGLPPKRDFEEIAYVKGTVVDSITKKPVKTIVELVGKGLYPTDEKGRFFICHPTLSGLKVTVSERKYYDYEKVFSLTNWNREGFAEIDIYLQPLNPPMNIAALNATFQAKNPGKVETIDAQTLKISKSATPTEEVYTTSDVYFYFDQYELTKEARFNLDKLIEDIDLDKLALIIVEGYTDQIGTDDYNQQLSEKRAKEVAEYFKAKGLQSLKIIYKGYGEKSASMIYSKNRKVDIIVYYKI